MCTILVVHLTVIFATAVLIMTHHTESSIKENRFISSVTVVLTTRLETCFTNIFNKPEIGKKIETFY